MDHNSTMPILDPNTLEFVSRSPDQTRRMGYRLGSMLQLGDVVCLVGDLGAGKTTLVQGIAKGWGSLDAVSSPTFILVNVYHRPSGDHLYHLDAYRMQNWLEAEDLDITLMLENGALVVEWPERIDAALPQERLELNMRWLGDEQRGMVFMAHGGHYEQLLAEFRRRTFGG